MRRIGIILGVVGGIVGSSYGFYIVSEVWESQTTAQRFGELVSHPAVTGAAQAAAREDKAGTPKWRPYEETVIAVDDSEVKSVTWQFGKIRSLQLGTGGSVPDEFALSRWGYLAAVFCALLGFLIPWRVIRTLSWILTGFASK